MTGVEKVRELARFADRARILRANVKPVERPRLTQNQWFTDGQHACLAYGSYLRGLIEADKAWFVDMAFGSEDDWMPDGHVEDAIAAWKKVINER